MGWFEWVMWVLEGVCRSNHFLYCVYQQSLAGLDNLYFKGNAAGVFGV